MEIVEKGSMPFDFCDSIFSLVAFIPTSKQCIMQCGAINHKNSVRQVNFNIT